jgi:hypothetical protein
VRTIFNGRLATIFYALIELTNKDAYSIAETIFKKLEDDKIPIDNITWLASDGANVMSGQHSSVRSRFAAKIPSIFFMKCICHTAHLCASYDCKKLPSTPEDFLRLEFLFQPFFKDSDRIS